MQLEELKAEVGHILSNDSISIDARLTSVCEYLQNKVTYYDWVGFYFANHNTKTLHLRAFAGEPTDHVEILFSKGICGQVAVSNNNFVVSDVNAQDNYISCSIDVKSEVVIPLFKNGVNLGQIDIDSHTVDAFDEE